MRLKESLKGKLIELLSIPSPSFKEQGVAKAALRMLNSEGVEAEIDAHGNVVASLEGREEKRIVLNAHMDTVQGELRVKAVEDVIYGRGATDMKGGLAGVIEALSLLAKGEPRYDVIFHGVVREEVDGYGSYSLNARGLKADLAIVAEPTGLDIFLGQRGRVTIYAKILGRAAHASKPELGVNAVLKACEAVKKLSRIRAKSHSILGEGRLTVTGISGGKESNVIPAECLLTMDRRLTLGETPEEALMQVREALKGLNSEVYLEERPTPYSTPFLIDRNPLIRELRSSVRRFHSCNYGVSRATTDASFYVNSGVPAVIFGPGNPDLAHTAEEHINIGEVVDFTRALVNFLS
jgi:succinyl-diaminopimelate desuccinylase